MRASAGRGSKRCAWGSLTSSFGGIQKIQKFVCMCENARCLSNQHLIRTRLPFPKPWIRPCFGNGKYARVPAGDNVCIMTRGKGNPG